MADSRKLSEERDALAAWKVDTEKSLADSWKLSEEHDALAAWKVDAERSLAHSRKQLEDAAVSNRELTEAL